MSELWLIGGWSIARTWWAPLVETLRAGGMVARPLQLAELAEDPYRWTDSLAARLRAAATPPLLVGWSMGAMVALDALTRPAAPPAAGLLVLAGTLRFCRAPDWPFGQPPAAVRALRRAVLRNAREALAAFYRQVREPASAETLPMPAEPMSDPRQLAAALDLLADLDLRDRPPPMCAVQWLHGDRDAVIPIEAGLESARCFGLTIEILPGAGHDLPGTHGMRVRDVLLCNMKCS